MRLGTPGELANLHWRLSAAFDFVFSALLEEFASEETTLSLQRRCRKRLPEQSQTNRWETEAPVGTAKRSHFYLNKFSVVCLVSPVFGLFLRQFHNFLFPLRREATASATEAVRLLNRETVCGRNGSSKMVNPFRFLMMKFLF